MRALQLEKKTTILSCRRTIDEKALPGNLVVDFQKDKVLHAASRKYTYSAILLWQNAFKDVALFAFFIARNFTHNVYETVWLRLRYKIKLFNRLLWNYQPWKALIVSCLSKLCSTLPLGSCIKHVILCFIFRTSIKFLNEEILIFNILLVYSVFLWGSSFST